MPNDRRPDDFFDMTIPDREDKDSNAPRPFEQSSSTTWKPGDRVLAPWEPDFLYSGVIREINADKAHIEFDDGDVGWVPVNRIRSIELRIGQQVLSRRQMGPMHFPAEIRDIQGDQVYVYFLDNNVEEWTGIGALRIPCQPLGDGAAPTKIASQQAFFDNVQPGTRVWAPWQSETLFAGTVQKINGDDVHIRFDDGDQGWVRREQLLPLDIPVGMVVMARRNMRKKFEPALIEEADGEHIHLRYDDGTREWTSPAAVALIAERYGPDARPSGAGNALGWLWPIIIVVVLAFLRIGCRNAM